MCTHAVVCTSVDAHMLFVCVLALMPVLLQSGGASHTTPQLTAEQRYDAAVNFVSDTCHPTSLRSLLSVAALDYD